MSIHYSKYANDAFRVEYIGRKPRNDCIKTIQVGDGFTPINFLFFSPDGTRIISSSKQGVCVWDATSGELIAGPLSGNDEYRVFSAAYLPDGRYIIGVSRNGIIRNWDVLTSSLVWERVTFEEQTNSRWIVSVIFSPDRKSVVFGDDQGSIEIWDVETGKRGGQMLGRHFDYINCFSFSSDGKYLASGSDDTTILIWDMDKKEARTGPLRGHTGDVMAVDFSPNGNTVISGSLDGNIYVWDVNLGEVLRKIICENVVYSVTYSPDGLFILAGGRRWMSMWNVVDAMAAPKVFNVVEYENVEYDEKELVWETSFSPDGSRFVTGCGKPNISDTIQIWDASWGMEATKAIFEEQHGEIWSISLSPGGKFIASGSYKWPKKDSIYLWNALTGELVKKLERSCGFTSISFSPINEQLIAFGSWDDGTVHLWDVTNDVTITIGNHKRRITCIAFSTSNENHVASGSDDATICIWDVERRELTVGPLIGHENGVTALAYSPDGTRLVSCSLDKTVRVWNSETGELLSTLSGHSSDVNCVAYSFDGSRIVSGSDDETIIVWDAQIGQIVCGPITGHKGDVSSACFSPDGKQVFSVSWRGAVRVGDAITGRSLFPPFTGHTSHGKFIGFFPNERCFATGSFDGTIRIWTLDTAPNDTTWELRDNNWVVDESGKLMMWIPNDLRRYLCHHRNISMFNRPFYLKLHFGTE